MSTNYNFWDCVGSELEHQKTNYEWLCQASNIHKSTLSGWRNRNVLPRVDEALRIAKALNVSLDSLIDPAYQLPKEEKDLIPLPLENLVKKFSRMPLEWQMLIGEHIERIADTLLEGKVENP